MSSICPQCQPMVTYYMYMLQGIKVLVNFFSLDPQNDYLFVDKTLMMMAVISGK